MDIFFDNPNDPPVPPEEVKIRRLTTKPYEDGRRVSVEFEVTPFSEKPNIEMAVFNPENKIVAAFSVLEAIENKMTFTLHLREEKPQGNYILKMKIYYTDLSALEDELTAIKDILLDNKKVVATAESNFRL
ncbi:MAG: hypothetical protein JW757_13745 [Anaerolineales bacterium]|nr:hypothetical protein [Anaerolineales bacterium]